MLPAEDAALDELMAGVVSAGDQKVFMLILAAACSRDRRVAGGTARTASDLTTELGRDFDGVSKHLRLLREAGAGVATGRGPAAHALFHPGGIPARGGRFGFRRAPGVGGLKKPIIHHRRRHCPFSPRRDGLSLATPCPRRHSRSFPQTAGWPHVPTPAMA